MSKAAHIAPHIVWVELRATGPERRTPMDKPPDHPCVLCRGEGFIQCQSTCPRCKGAKVEVVVDKATFSNGDGHRYSFERIGKRPA